MKMKLGDVCKFIGGGTPSKKNPAFYGGIIPWATVRDMNVRVIKTTEHSITPDAVQQSATNIIPKGEVVISTHVGLGKVCFLGQDTAINQDLKAVIPNGELSRRYLYYWFISKADELIANGKGATVKGVTLDFVKNLKIQVLPEREQEVVSDTLDKVNHIIELADSQVARLDQLVKSRFVEMFGILAEHRFEQCSLESICEFIKDGTHQTPTYTSDTVNGYKFLSSKDVVGGVIDWSRIKYIPRELHEELYARLSPRKNDILLAKNGTTGIAALVETDEVFDIYVSLALLRFKTDVDMKYILWAINSSETKRQFNHSLKGVGVPNLHLGEIKKTIIPLPPLPLQREFAAFVAKVDKLAFAARQRWDVAKKLYRAKIQEFFG